MPVRESEAIILRTYALGEGDRLVSFFSRSEGRVRGVARGARRAKSRFGASLEPLSYIRIWFYERDARQLVRVSQCELIESFWKAQSSYNGSLAFALLAEISESILPEREPSDPAFRLLLATCRAMDRTGLVALPVCYFAVWMLRLGGWLSSVERCGNCGRSLTGQEVWAARDGSGMFCRDCRPGQALRLSEGEISVLRVMLRESLEGLADNREGPIPVKLTNYMLDLIEGHMEKKSGVRPMLELTP